MIRRLVHLSCICLAVVLLASAGSAQTIDGAGGWAYRNEKGLEEGERLSIENGWFGALGGNLNDSFGAFFQVSQHRANVNVSGVDVKSTLTIWGGGPRISGNQRSGVTYFGQVLFGQARVNTSVEGVECTLPDCRPRRFAVQPAVGVDVKAGGIVGVRFEFAPTYIKPKSDSDEDAWAYHLMVGIVLRGG